MNGVHGVLHALEPVAGDDGGADLPVHVVLDEQVPVGDQGGRVRAEVGPDEAGVVLDRVGLGHDAVLEGAVRGLGGHLQTLAGLVEEPAVVGAAETVLFGDAVEEVDAAVGAGLLDEAQVAAAVLEQDQVLAEDAHGLGGGVVHLHTAGDRMPVAAEECAHIRAGADVCEAFVFLDAQHGLLLFALNCRRLEPAIGRGRRRLAAGAGGSIRWLGAGVKHAGGDRPLLAAGTPGVTLQGLFGLFHQRIVDELTIDQDRGV